jgi:hypothetical protein
MKLENVLILIVLLICGIINSGCTNSKIENSSSPTIPPTAIIQTSHPTKEITIVPVIPDLQKHSIDGWELRNIPDSKMSIYIPKGWTIQTRNRTYDGKTYDNILVVLSPDFDILINAYSHNLADKQYLLQKELAQGYIDDEMYQSLISSANPQSTTVSEIITDPIYYSISGFPARKIEWKQDGSPMKAYIIIPDNNSIVITKLEDTTSTNPSYYMENERHKEAEESIKSVTE